MLLDSIFDHVQPKTLAVAFALLAVSYWTIKVISASRKIQNLGGRAPAIPTYLPGSVDMIARAVHNTIHHKNLEGWGRFFRNGNGNYTAEVSLIGQRIVFTADSENIKAILATQFQDYGKGKPFHEEWKAFLGDSIFTTDLDQWHDSRQLIRPQFIKDRVSDLEVFEKHTQILLNSLANGGVTGVTGTASDGIGKGRQVDASDLLFRYTLDAATDFLLGKSVNSLELAEQDFAIAFSEVQRVQNIIARAGPAKAFVPMKSFNDGLKVINEFVNPYIDRALQLSPEELATKSKSESGYTFLHALAGFTRDRTVLRDQLVAVLLAGRDTTAATLSWVIFELARHPEIVAKLRREIIDTVGLERPPTYEHLKSMKYLQSTLNETLRIYPVVPFNVRMALKDTSLPHGGGADGRAPVGILKNTAIGYSTLVLQRRADLYPASWASPETPELHHLNFYPDRWASWQPKPWTYIPFNGGPRICIGQQFALTEMAYTLVRLLQRFERIQSYMDPKVEPILKAEIVLQPGMPVNVGFWESGSGKDS